MGTKEKPGPYDCYDKALPDEPIFVLLARDYKAPFVIREWVRLSKIAKDTDAKYQEAAALANEMETWREKNKDRIKKAKRDG